jgi:hypothetical protein
MAHEFAVEMDVTPWEALLLVVRITAGRVRYCERVLAEARDDRELDGRLRLREDGTWEPLSVSQSGELVEVEVRDRRWWVETSERERDRLARVSKAALDAGIAQIMVQREIEQGDLIAATHLRVFEAAVAAGVEGRALDAIREAMKAELLALESGLAV